VVEREYNENLYMEELSQTQVITYTGREADSREVCVYQIVMTLKLIG
jgi:hypothetical protein